MRITGCCFSGDYGDYYKERSIMRLNRRNLCVLVLSGVFFMICGCGDRSDVITGAGGGVVKDLDPSLPGMDRGFKVVSVDGGKVSPGSSIPVSRNPTFSTESSPSGFMVGVNDDGDTLRANMQFLLPDTTLKSKYNSGDSPDSAYLYFRAIGTDTIPKGAISVYESGTVEKDEITFVTSAVNTVGGALGSFELDGRMDFIKLNDALLDSIFNARTSSKDDGAGTVGFAFSIIDYYEDVRKISNPQIILFVTKADKSTVRDTINSAFTFFTAFENELEITERVNKPYSSENTRRAASFEIDISEIIDEAKTTRREEVINATISFKVKTKSDNAQYRIAILDEPLTNEDQDPIEWAQRNGNRAFTDTGRLRVNNDVDQINVHQIKPVIRNAIDKSNNKLYVYLRPITDHSVVEWDKESVTVEAILTPSLSSRSR